MIGDTNIHKNSQDVVLIAAYTEIYALVEVFVIHVLWLQTYSESAIFWRPII